MEQKLAPPTAKNEIQNLNDHFSVLIIDLMRFYVNEIVVYLKRHDGEQWGNVNR